MTGQDEIQQLLAQMHGIQLPSEIPWWSFSVWLWLALAFLIAIACATTFTVLFLAKKNKIRKLALLSLASLKKREDLDNQQQFMELNILLKRCAFSYIPLDKQRIAGLYGQAWYDYLILSLPPKLKDLNQYQSMFLEWEHASLSPQADKHALENYYKFSKLWIKHSDKQYVTEALNSLEGAVPC